MEARALVERAVATVVARDEHPGRCQQRPGVVGSGEVLAVMVEVMAKAVAEALVTHLRGDGVGEAAEVRGERREARARWRRGGGSPRRARLALATEVLVALVEVMATVMTAMADSGWGDATTSATRRLFTSERVSWRAALGQAGHGWCA